MNKFFSFLTLFLAVCFIFSCQKDGTKKEKCLHLSFSVDPKTLDSRKSGDYISSATLFMLNNGLTQFLPDGKIGPAIAKSYEISQDQKVYTFHLRDCEWSDGHKVTAYDFEKAWKKMLDPNFPALCRQLLYPIKNAEAVAKKLLPIDTVGIRVVDDNTLIVELENPTPYFLSLTSFCIFFPIPTHLEEKDPAWDLRMDNTFVSNGPFKLVKWTPTSELKLIKNPKYWDSQKVKIDALHVSIISDENTAFEMFEKGELDLIGSPLSPIPLDCIPSVLKRKELILVPAGGTNFCAFNINLFPLNNINIRKALSLAICRRAIVDNITQLKEPIAGRILPPVIMNGKERNLIEDYNLTLANKFLEKGLKELNVTPKDIVITLYYPNKALYQREAEAVQEQWQKGLGITVKLEQNEEKSWQERIHKHNFHASIAFWIVQYDDALNILDRFKYKDHPKNYPGWENSTYIDLLNQSLPLTDSTARVQILEKAEDLLAEELPFTPIFHYNYAILTSPRIKGTFVGKVGELHFDAVDFIEEN